jgi:2-octaprenylphenol hydroxylase
MHVWDSTGSGRIDFDCADIGEPNLGHIVENQVILSALRKVIAHYDQIKLYTPHRGVALEQSPTAVTLTLDNDEQLTAPLLVATDGANSWVRDQVGITTTGWSYDQTAVVATVTTAHTHAEAAWQRFTPEGPIAFLPLPDANKSSIVWSVSPEHAQELMALEKEPFLQQLHSAFGDNLGEMVDCGKRGAFPLILKHANRYSEGRVVLMGNSAHAIHPLAGQGLNIGVSDVAALAELVVDAKRNNKDIGAHKLLRHYERWRKTDNVAVMGSMDIFKRVYSNDNPLLSVARNVGMTLANHAGPIKDIMIKRAMGIGGDLPKMTQGITL